MDELREKVAREIAIIRGLIPWEKLSDKKVEKQFGGTIINGYASKEGCYEYADQIIPIVREAVLEELIPKDYSPALLFKWVERIEREDGYRSTLSHFLSKLATNWEALKGKK